MQIHNMTSDKNNIQPIPSTSKVAMTLDQLADRILLVDDTLRQQVAHAVNCMLTARNWFIGFYIVEFEQHGADRAQYGEQLLKTLSKRINRKGMTWRRLYEYRTFYKVYPQLHSEILHYLQSQMQRPKESPIKKLRSLPSIFQIVETEAITKLQSLTAISPEPWQTSPDRIFHRISYTSLQMLSEINDPLKRAFFEFELIQGCWTTRELDRQISSLYYERSALSKDKNALKRYIQQSAEPMETHHILRDPMTLEFLDLPEAEAYTETKLETAILDKIEHFLMELGQGFCFEHRQKRILIDHDYFKADLIFYNRILHCHVIIDLKIDRYRHEYGSQLNTYKNYYRHEVMQPGDNPPIGLLLCTDYSETLVKYSTEGLEDIYVGKYLLQLPSEDTIRQYLIDNMPDQKDFENFTSESYEGKFLPPTIA